MISRVRLEERRFVSGLSDLVARHLSSLPKGRFCQDGWLLSKRGLADGNPLFPKMGRGWWWLQHEDSPVQLMLKGQVPVFARFSLFWRDRFPLDPGWGVPPPDEICQRVLHQGMDWMMAQGDRRFRQAIAQLRRDLSLDAPRWMVQSGEDMEDLEGRVELTQTWHRLLMAELARMEGLLSRAP